LNPKRNTPTVEGASLPIAVRVYPLKPDDTDSQSNYVRRFWRGPDAILVFDCETRVDSRQTLTFGSYQAVIRGRRVEEGLFYGNELSQRELNILRNYVKIHKPDVSPDGHPKLRLLSLRQFLKEFYADAYKTRCLVAAFNLPFDLSRIAYAATAARRRYAGGFSLCLWTYLDKKHGRECKDPNRPRILIKHIDSKRALIGFGGRLNTDPEDRITEGPTTGKPEDDFKFKGHFLDLRTLAFALTDRGYDLERACKDFGVEHPKEKATKHGAVTARYIDYNRLDALATAELAIKLIEEFRKHPLSMQATRAFSPASIGKGYLRDMGIEPVLKRQPKFPTRYLGNAQSAFFGGRSSAHIRKIPIPVVYTDFLSMYPTVNSLMGLWRYVVAEKIRVVPHRQNEARSLLRRIKLSDLFRPFTWKHFPYFVRVIPNRDALPSRSCYSSESRDWQVALNYLSAKAFSRKDALWFSLPDVIASRLLTGRMPRIIDAFRFDAVGTLRTLKPIKLRRAVSVDPTRQDFFKVVIEQRQRLKTQGDVTIESKRLNKALKVLANAASYGIYAEMNREESDKPTRVNCHGLDKTPFSCVVLHPEKTGAYCFPPLAALITGAARLMLALLERTVTDCGGTYAMEDTDSMAIVATKTGGLVRCEGGARTTSSGLEAVNALSWKKVEQISEKFKKLNPYDRTAVPGSILKIEDENRDPLTNKQRQIHCLAISTKRYALFEQRKNGAPRLLRRKTAEEKDRWSEHGLGHLLNPIDPESKDRDWISQIWLNIVRRALGLPTKALGFEHLPAVGRITVSSPAVMKPLENLNKGKKYADQIKPFNFLISCHVKAFGHPFRADPGQFHLIAPYDPDPRRWLQTRWIDQYSGNEYGITTIGPTGDRYTARVKTYGEVIEEYEFHPESKCADSYGHPCQKETRGLLQRRRITIDEIRFIGKESNSLEEVEAGLIHDERSVYTQYNDPKRDVWATKTRRAIKKTKPSVLINACRGFLSSRALRDIRAGRSTPHRKNRERLEAIARKLRLI